jgi:starvation-inducible DNA-binding protein
MAKHVTALKSKTHVEDMETGLSANYRKQISEALTEILSDTYRLLIKSHVYHWNVVGPLFKPLHELIEEQYRSLFEAADIIAERIRALGHLAPVHLADASKFAPETASTPNPDAQTMIKDLIRHHEASVRMIRKAAVEADDNEDFVTNDVLTDRLTFHEKALWMLRAQVA